MPSVFRVDSYDFWPFVQISKELSPADPDFLTAAFGEAGGLEGEPLISLNAGNREWLLPVLLSPHYDPALPKTKDGLHALIATVNRRLRAAQRLEWREDGAAASTFFDVLFARFEPAYDYRKAQALYVGGTIRVTAKPYGSTGTSRLAATAAGRGCALTMALPSIAGDQTAPAVIRVAHAVPAGGATLAVQGRIVGAAALPSSYTADFPAASIILADPSAFRSGGSGAPGSQFISTEQGRQGVRSTFAEIRLSPASAYQGRNRVLAVARSDAGEQTLVALDSAGRELGRAVASARRGAGWGTIDLGTVTVDAVTRPEGFDTFSLAIDGYQPAGFVSGGLAAGRLDVALILVLPEDSSVVLDTRRQLLSTAVRPIFAGGGYVDDFGAPIARPQHATARYGSVGSLYAIPDGHSNAGMLIVHAPVPALAVEAKWIEALGVGSRALVVGRQPTVGSACVYAVAAADGSGNVLSLAIRQEGFGAPGMSSGVLLASVALPNHPGYVGFRWVEGAVTAYARDLNGAPLIELNTRVSGSPQDCYAVVAQIGPANARLDGVRVLAVPSQGYLASEEYELNAERGAAYRQTPGGSRINADVSAGLRGAPAVRIDPLRHGKVIAFHVPLDEMPANGELSASVRIRERFTYARG